MAACPWETRPANPATSWVNPLSLAIGALFVATSAYMAAVFLVSDARRAGTADLERYFSNRALLAGVVAGAAAAVSLVALRSDARYVFDRLTSEGLPLVVVSALCGVAVLILLRLGVGRARPLAVGAVAAVVWGWAVAQYPYLLPEKLTIAEGAAPQPGTHRRPDRLRRCRGRRSARARASVHVDSEKPGRGDVAACPWASGGRGSERAEIGP